MYRYICVWRVQIFALKRGNSLFPSAGVAQNAAPPGQLRKTDALLRIELPKPELAWADCDNRAPIYNEPVLVA